MSEKRPLRVTGTSKKPPVAEEPTTQLTVVEIPNPEGVEHTVEVFIRPEAEEKDYSHTLAVPVSRAAQYHEQLASFEHRHEEAERLIARGLAEREAAFREFAAQTTWIGEQIHAEEEAEEALEAAKWQAERAAQDAELDARDARLDKKYGPALWVYLPKLTKSRGRHGGAILRAWWMVHTAKCQHAKEHRDSRPVVSGEELVSLKDWEYGRERVYGRARADMIAKVAKTPGVEFCGRCKPLNLLDKQVPNWRYKEWK